MPLGVTAPFQQGMLRLYVLYRPEIERSAHQCDTAPKALAAYLRKYLRDPPGPFRAGTDRPAKPCACRTTWFYGCISCLKANRHIRPGLAQARVMTGNDGVDLGKVVQALDAPHDSRCD